MDKIELLAPAGSMGSLKAAISSGADAVYLGMKSFGARASATNFDDNYLKDAVRLCRSNNVKLFLTMNTLVRNDELNRFARQLEYAYSTGIDSVIVQEVSLIQYIKKSFPDLRVHVSTQAGVMNSYHANLMKDADRITLARELTKDEIIEIRKNCNLELETFCHGALCVSVSGNCLFSSFLGGRSGNRGRCAQPCRKKYNNCYYLSPKDLCLIDRIPELINTKADSIKIEGRMRTPYYVATVTGIYREAIDRFYEGDFSVDPRWRKKLLTAFNRTFTEGFFKGSSDMFNRKDSSGKETAVIKEYAAPIKDIKIGRKPSTLQLPIISAKTSDQKNLIVKTYNSQDAICAAENGADIVCLDIYDENFAKAKTKINNKGAKLFATTPRIMLDLDIPKIVDLIDKNKPDGIFAGNLGVLGLDLSLPTYLDYSLNTFNDIDISSINDLGAMPMISPELSIKDVCKLKNKNFGVLVHGKIPLMTLRHRFADNVIKDETGAEFMLEKVHNGTLIFNKKELGLFSRTIELAKKGVVNFFIDTENDIGTIVMAYRKILNSSDFNDKKIRKNYVLGWAYKGVQ